MNNVNLHNNITPILTVSLNTYSPSELGWIEISKTINKDEVVIDLKKKYPSPLHAALTLQDIDLIKKILDLNLPINLPDEIRGNTALNLAMVFSTEEIVLLLIEKGADIHKTSKQGWTYLHEAILRNMPVVVETLINQLDINAIAHLVDQSALSCSFLTNDPIDSSQTIPISPLYLAIRLNLDKINRQEIAVLLLKKGADISFQHPKGVNLLHLAIANDYEEVCEILLKKKMDPDQGFQMHVDVKNLNCDEKYKTLAKPILDMSPLFLAVDKNSISLVRLLLNFGANFSNFSPFTNPIFVILDTCNKEMLKEFVDKGFRMDQEIFGIPIAISIENKIESIKLALELGANINHKFSEGNTYLHIAVTTGDLPLCKFLIEHGADINACNDEKNSILHEALIRINKNEELIIFLLSNGADARCVNLKGYTPLHYLDKLKLNTLSDNVKALLNASDKGLTSYLLQLRLLGLRFALKGKMFEGSNRHSTYQEIAVSLDKYLSAEKKNYAYLEPLKTSLQQSTSLSSEKILDLLKEKKQVTISLGWPGHEIIAILCDEFLMLGNRGDGCQESGLTLYKINDSKNLKDSIQALLNFKEVSYEPSIKIDEFFQNPNAISEERQKFDEVTIENAKAFIYKKLQEELHLDVIDSFPLKNQTVGNCTWMAAKMGLLGGLILTLHRENPTKSLKEIKKEAKQIYAEWKQFDNLHSLEILKEVENDPLIKTLVDFEIVYNELFVLNFCDNEILKKLCTLQPRLQSWIERPDPRLINYAYQHESLKALKKLVEKGLNLNLNALSKVTNPKLIKFHFDYFLNKGIKANKLEASEITALQALCEHCQSPQLLELLKAWKKEADELNEPSLFKNALNERTESLTALHRLLIYTDTLSSIKEVIVFMIASGADPSLNTPRGNNSIHLALNKIVNQKDIDVFEILLSKTDLSQLNQPDNPIFDKFSLDKDYSASLAKVLFEAGAKLNRIYLDEKCTDEVKNLFIVQYLKQANNMENSLLHKICKELEKDPLLEQLKIWKNAVENLNESKLLETVLNLQDEKGSTLLYNLINSARDLAAMNSITAFLIDCGADSEIKNYKGYVAIEQALLGLKKEEDTTLISTLLKGVKNPSIFLNKLNDNGLTIFTMCRLDKYFNLLLPILLDAGAPILSKHVTRASPEILDIYLEYFSTHGSLINYELENGQTLLHLLCSKIKGTPLLNLLTNWKKEQPELLKATLNHQNEKGYTPLYKFIAHCKDLASNMEIISLMIDAGADPSITNKDESSLHLAIKKIVKIEDVPVIQQLLKGIKDPAKSINQPNGQGLTAMDLFQFRMDYSQYLMIILLEAGGQVLTQHLRRYDINPLIMNLFAEYYIKNGIDINYIDSEGFTPLNLIVYTDYTIGTKILESWKATAQKNGMLIFLTLLIRYPLFPWAFFHP